MNYTLSVRLRVGAASLYWLLYIFVFVGLKYSDDEGGIPLIVLGLPWSIPVLAVSYAASSALPLVDGFLITAAGNFFMTVLVCGALNVALIIGMPRVVRWLRDPQHLAICALAGIGLLASVQLASPWIEHDALERSRPRNVPPEAVHVGGVRGVWQHCTLDSARTVNLCRIWNCKGLMLDEGEFVPYDRGVPATVDQLEIKTDNAMPQTIALRNGRILIPKAREADMRRFVGSLVGHE